jgi:serine/threonine-protein kinase
LQLCEALGEAHAAGIVHRDLKPANLFLTRREDGGPHIKVVDFGISKILDAKLKEDGGPREVTSAFTVLGSPRYMAPEQLRNSKDVDGRADLWSVGAVLFQLVTGRHAFDAESNVQASIRVLGGEPESLRALAPHAPPELEAIVRRCLAKDVADRFQTAEELAKALRPFASKRTRESIDRMRQAKSTTVGIALAASSLSEPPPPPAMPRDVPTSPRAFAPPAPPPSGSGPASRSEPPMVASVQKAYARAPGAGMKIAIAAGGLVAVLVVFGVLTLAKGMAVRLGIVRSPEAEPPVLPAAEALPPQPAATARDPIVVPVASVVSAPGVVPLDAATRRP